MEAESANLMCEDSEVGPGDSGSVLKSKSTPPSSINSFAVSPTTAAGFGSIPNGVTVGKYNQYRSDTAQCAANTIINKAN